MEEKAAIDMNQISVSDFKAKKKAAMEESYMWIIYIYEPCWSIINRVLIL